MSNDQLKGQCSRCPKPNIKNYGIIESLKYVSGGVLVEAFAQLRETTITRLNQLPPHRLGQALDFIDFLLNHPDSSVPPTPKAPQGSLEDLLACTGIWEFEPGELEEVLRDIEQSRLMELEKAYGSLLA